MSPTWWHVGATFGPQTLSLTMSTRAIWNFIFFVILTNTIDQFILRSQQSKVSAIQVLYIWFKSGEKNKHWISLFFWKNKIALWFIGIVSLCLGCWFVCRCVGACVCMGRGDMAMWNNAIFMKVLVEVVFCESVRTHTHTYTCAQSSAVQWCSPDICICHSDGQCVSASVISKHFGVNKLLIFSISTDDNVASSWEPGKVLSRGHSLDVNCVWQMVLSV